MLKAMIGIEGQPGFHFVDAIEHAGHFWLVPEWVASTAQGLRSPARIILLDVLPHNRMEPGDWRGDFVLKQPIPKAVLDGSDPSRGGGRFVVEELPPIEFPYEPQK